MSELNIVNKAARAVRDEQFKWAKIVNWNNGPILVSEGDSWFQHPIENDIIDTLAWFTHGYKIRSLGAAGDRLSEMVQHLEFPQAIRDENPEAFLFSGGGNDFVDEGLAKSLHDSTNITIARECFDEGPFNAELDKLAALYRTVYSKAPRLARPQTPIIGMTAPVSSVNRRPRAPTRGRNHYRDPSGRPAPDLGNCDRLGRRRP